MPRDQAVMPYWVPRVLRFQKQVVKRQPSLKGSQETPLDGLPRHRCWQVCCDVRLLFPWQQPQAPLQDEPPASGRGASLLALLLPLGLLTLLQAVMRLLRHFWGV
ncbi:uncharacterized protein C16orf95 homolog [Carlito syrichta]|uniref:Uncharacterized protein C16orf95 homolog n=1 Tax=Carlito syrichta TaxID=1868482 RepID=A0A3Q0DXL4_CARSF|nr:uncharacterized protein C16orf95 homolog [Carlito syrichta]